MKSITRCCLLFGAILILVTACSSGAITVRDAWARPAAMGQNSAVYFVVENDTGTDDMIVGIAGDVSNKIETHETRVDDNNVASMHHMPEIDLLAGKTLNFEPGGLHVMLMMVNKVLEPGDIVIITLQFENSPDLIIEAEVREP